MSSAHYSSCCSHRCASAAPASNRKQLNAATTRPRHSRLPCSKRCRKQAALVSEFEVNGLKVLLKRREGSLTVAAGLFIRGGAANINAQNAGIETLMLSAATEASTSFPRARMRSELSRMGTVIGSSSNNDYSVLSLATTRMHFDRSWQIFTDVVLRPSFTKEDVALVQERLVVRSATTPTTRTFTCKSYRSDRVRRSSLSEQHERHAGDGREADA